MNQRDHTLDYMKGIGCMLMVFSHSQVYGSDLVALTNAGLFVGRLSPVLFFSVSGVVNAIQAKRRPLRYFAVFAGLFALLGVIYNCFTWPDAFYRGFAPDIPQIVAFTIFVTVLVEKSFRNPTAGYALVAALMVLGHYLLAAHLPDFPLRSFFFVPWPQSGVFPPVPWLVFPMLGNIAYRLSDRVIHRIAFALLAVFAAAFSVSYGYLPRVVFWHFWADKWYMPAGYLLLCVTVLFTVFAILRQWGDRLVHPAVTYIGRNSFPFMFIHLSWIHFFGVLGINNPLIVWPSVLLLTLPTIYVCDKLNKRYVERHFTSSVAWVIYAVLLAVQLIVIRDFSPLLFLLGLIFAYEYRPLAQALKQYFTSKNPSVHAGHSTTV